jgi:hypothetical protein
MTDQYTQFERLHKRVMQEVARQRLLAQHLPPTQHHARLLAEFLRARLDVIGHTPQQLARDLMMSQDITDALLDGSIPEWMISDEALHRIASVVESDVNVLRIMLKRAVPPSQIQQAHMDA